MTIEGGPRGAGGRSSPAFSPASGNSVAAFAPLPASQSIRNKHPQQEGAYRV